MTNDSIQSKPEPEAQSETSPTEPPEAQSKPNESKANWHRRFKNWYLLNKKLSIPLTIIVLVALILLIPWTRYNSLGFFLKKNYKISIIDSVTQSPVSGASVSFGSINVQTDGSGQATIKAKVGPKTLSISKKYYKDHSAHVVVPILGQKSTPSIMLEATGRQVKITVVNTISKSALSGVNIKFSDINAQTDSAGNANVVLPPGVAEQKATLSRDGYVTTDVKVKVSDQKIEQNNFTLTPAGKVYFLSKRTGKINLMKSNLDGSDQSIVVAGTGKENESDTILLASRDWKYLTFKAKRDDGPAKVYYIDTSVDKLNVLDEGDASFTMIGWSDNYFIYKVSRNSVANWQSNREALKSFNAQTAKLLILNQTSGAGSGSYDYAHEVYGYGYGVADVYIIDSKVIFTKSWEGYYNSSALNGKQAAVYSINTDGSSFKNLYTLHTYNSSNSYINISSILYEPNEIYYSSNDYTSQGEHFYKYINNSVSKDDGLKDAYNKFNSQPYPTYLLSPSGKQTFWVELRDGKKVIVVAEADGGNEKEIAKLGDEFQNYGYYTDDYLLVSKKSSELYVMPATGVKDESGLIKITDYHKPAYNFRGYGGGYGGL